jgi:quinol monooxygenase YgiN
MIVRIFRVRVLPGKVDEWRHKVEAFSIPWLRRQEGLIAFYPGQPMDSRSREFSMTSVWQDADSIRKAVGEDWRQAVLLEDEAELVETVEMHHFETFGQDD